MPFTKMSNNH